MKNEPSRTYPVVPAAPRGGGPGSAGQSGDTQGLSDVAETDSESVQELLEEGQYFEAEVLLGVEAADDDGDPKELYVNEVPEDGTNEEDGEE